MSAEPKGSFVAIATEQLMHNSLIDLENRKILREHNIHAASNQAAPYNDEFRRCNASIDTFHEFKSFRRGAENATGLSKNVRTISTLVKHLRKMSQMNKDFITEKIKTTDLSKFLDEALDAVVDATFELKRCRIEASVQIISLLHQHYDGFSAALINRFKRVFNDSDPAPVGKYRLSEQRNVLLLMTGMFAAGLVSDAQVVIGSLQHCIRQVAFTKGSESMSFLNLIADFVLCAGVDLLDIRPAWVVAAELALDAASRKATGKSVVRGLLSELAACVWGQHCMQNNAADRIRLLRIVEDSIVCCMPSIRRAIATCRPSAARPCTVRKPGEAGGPRLFKRLAALRAVADLQGLDFPAMDRQFGARLLAAFGVGRQGIDSEDDPGNCGERRERDLYGDERTRALYQARGRWFAGHAGRGSSDSCLPAGPGLIAVQVVRLDVNERPSKGPKSSFP